MSQIPAAESIPRYVRFQDSRPVASWTAYNYQFVAYDVPFMRKMLQAVIDEAGTFGSLSVAPNASTPLRDETPALRAAQGRVDQCAPLAGDFCFVAIGARTRDMVVRLTMESGANVITVTTSKEIPESEAASYVNTLIHMAMK